MNRITKLNSKLLSGGGLSFREFQNLLDHYGWSLVRTTGSHHIYTHPLVDRPLPITPDGKSAREYQLRQFRDMVERFGLTMDDA